MKKHFQIVKQAKKVGANSLEATAVDAVSSDKATGCQNSEHSQPRLTAVD